MKQLQPNSRQKARCWRIVTGALAFAWVMTNATSAAAQPGGPPGHREHGKPPEHGALRPEHGPGKGAPPMMHGPHEHEGVGDAGVGPVHGGPPEAVRQRRLRLAELKSKLDAGKLTHGEQSELEQLQKQQARHDALDASLKAKDATRPARAREAKRQALKENPNLGKDPAALAEYRKYAERMAKLDRAKELATADNNTAMVQKIDSLIAKEQQRHAAWVAKIPPSAQGAAQ
jgi:hypothetical protein